MCADKPIQSTYFYRPISSSILKAGPFQQASPPKFYLYFFPSPTELHGSPNLHLTATQRCLYENILHDQFTPVRSKRFLNIVYGHTECVPPRLPTI